MNARELLCFYVLIFQLQTEQNGNAENAGVHITNHVAKNTGTV